MNDIIRNISINSAFIATKEQTQSIAGFYQYA